MPATLYASLQQAVGNECNIAEIMDGWVTQPGFPVLNVNVADDRQHVVVTQNRFLQIHSRYQDKTRWTVPLTYATNKENSDFARTKPTGYLANETASIKLKEPADWIVFNVQQSGYYRVNYDSNGWTAIANVLHKSPTDVHVLNRAQVRPTIQMNSTARLRVKITYLVHFFFDEIKDRR